MPSSQHPAELPRRHTHNSHQSSLLSRLSRKKHRADTMYSGKSTQSHDTTVSSLVYDHYSSYEITWDTLKAFLQRKWPDRQIPDDGEKVNFIDLARGFRLLLLTVFCIVRRVTSGFSKSQKGSRRYVYDTQIAYLFHIYERVTLRNHRKIETNLLPCEMLIKNQLNGNPHFRTRKVEKLI